MLFQVFSKTFLTFSDDNDNDEQELFQLTPREALTTLDRLVYTSGISEGDQNTLVPVKEKL